MPNAKPPNNAMWHPALHNNIFFTLPAKVKLLSRSCSKIPASRHRVNYRWTHLPVVQSTCSKQPEQDVIAACLLGFAIINAQERIVSERAWSTWSSSPSTTTHVWHHHHHQQHQHHHPDRHHDDHHHHCHDHHHLHHLSFSSVIIIITMVIMILIMVIMITIIINNGMYTYIYNITSSSSSSSSSLSSSSSRTSGMVGGVQVFAVLPLCVFFWGWLLSFVRCVVLCCRAAWPGFLPKTRRSA